MAQSQSLQFQYERKRSFVDMIKQRQASGCLARLFILAMVVTIAMTSTNTISKTKVMKFKIHHTDVQFFTAEASHTGFG